jgi:hypothetical protein
VADVPRLGGEPHERAEEAEGADGQRQGVEGTSAAVSMGAFLNGRYGAGGRAWRGRSAPRG